MSGVIELIPFAAVVRAVGALYWIVALGALIAALALPKLWWKRMLAAACVLVIFGWLPVRSGIRAYKARARLQASVALFQERCKTAGEKIHRAVDGVDGILLLKLRPGLQNYDDQFAMDDPYGNDLSGDGYIETFLRGGYKTSPRGSGRSADIGYLYVEVLGESEARYRYTGSAPYISPPADDSAASGARGSVGLTKFVLRKSPSQGPAPRYGVTFDDISTREDREHWIAGSSLKVIDLQAHEVIAERIGYMMDLQQGNRSGGRGPWLYAANDACPSFSNGRMAYMSQWGAADKFVEKVLKPSSGVQ